MGYSTIKTARNIALAGILIAYTNCAGLEQKAQEAKLRRQVVAELRQGDFSPFERKILDAYGFTSYEEMSRKEILEIADRIAKDISHPDFGYVGDPLQP